MAAVWFQGPEVDSGDAGIVMRADDPSYAGLCRGVSLIQRQMQFITALTDRVIKTQPNTDISNAVDSVRKGVDSYGLTLPQKDEAVSYLKRHATDAYRPLQKMTQATNLDTHAAQEVQRVLAANQLHLRME